MVISWPVLGLAGIKVKFQASTAFWFQPVQGLCPCGQRFSSGQWVFFSSGVRGGLLPVKTETTYECVSGFIYVFQRTGSSVTLTWLSYHLNCYSSLAQQLSFVSTASLFPVINSFFFFNFYFYFILLYNTVLVLPYIDMNPPWVLTRESVFCFKRQGHQGLEDSFTVVSTACVRLVS